MARPGGGRLRIGELARRSGVTAKAIRFYEARGVLPPAARGPNGYRLYDDQAVEMLRFVRQAGRLGLRLGEIREAIVCPHIEAEAGATPARVRRGGQR